MLPNLTIPSYPGGSGAVPWLAPDGELLVGQQKDGIDQVIDWSGHRYARLSNHAYYQWSDDGHHFCATVDTDATHIDLQLIDLFSGATRTIARIARTRHDTTLQPRACSLVTGLAVLEESRASSRGPLVLTITAYDITSGRRVAFYDYSTSTASFAVVAPDGRTFAVSDRTHIAPAVVRNLRDGTMVATINDRWVIALSNGGPVMLTAGDATGTSPIVEERDAGGRIMWTAAGSVETVFGDPLAPGFVLLLFPHGPGSQSQFVFLQADGTAKVIVTGARPV